jgi:signal transduction histidine kinase/CheY-like chemotaxis protein
VAEGRGRRRRRRSDGTYLGPERRRPRLLERFAVAPWSRNATLPQRQGLGVLVFLILIALDLFLAVSSLSHLATIEDRVQVHDFELVRQAELAQVALLDEETGLRGYLLTADKAFLEPLDRGRAAYDDAALVLDRTAAGDAAVHPRLVAFETAVQQWRTGYQDQALINRPNMTTQAVAAAAGGGKVLFDRIRGAHAELVSAIDRQRQADVAEEQGLRSSTLVLQVAVSAVGAALGSALVLFALFSILPSLRALRQVASELQGNQPISMNPPPGPPELREVHAAIAMGGYTLQERETELIIASRELAEASRLKSDFLATMSHELRTPLNAILGFSDLLVSGMAGEMSDTAKDFLERISRNGKLLLALINDILDISKIEAGRMVMTCELLALDRVVEQVAGNVQTLAQAKGLTLDTPGPAERALVLGDARALGQVLTNLLGNAVKFTEAGSVGVEIEAAGGRTILRVVDTGVGIDPADLERIFDPFRQVGVHAKMGQGGTGLGLAISSRLAEQMRGRLTVSSRPSEGSTFSLELPSARASLNLVDRAQERPLVLALADDFESLEGLQAQVERLGYDFVGLDDPGVAELAAADMQPAVVLLDILIPAASTWETLHRLSEEPRTADIPVVIASSGLTPLDSRRGLSVVARPSSDEELALALRQAIDSSIPQEAGV